MKKSTHRGHAAPHEAREARPAATALRHVAAVALAGVAMLLSACATPTHAPTSSPVNETPLEDIHILRSIREPQTPTANWCAPSRTGFEPYPADAERYYSFWSVKTRPEDGKVTDAKQSRVATLRGCFGPTPDRARQNFYAEVQLGAIAFQGRGVCLAMMLDFPATGLFPVRCQLVLSSLSPPYIGGLLTTNTITSRSALGGDTDPPGYTQASIATIRLWKAR